jgi:hypothetical protein
MTRRFSKTIAHVGNRLPRSTFGRLVATFESSSPIPLHGGKDSGRHIYLALKVADESPQHGIFECAVNVRSEEGTEVLFADRIEQSPPPLSPGFTSDVHLTYGSGPSAGDDVALGLTDDDFSRIQNDNLFDRIRNLADDCDLVEVYGVTYDDGQGVHDVHMNSGTDPRDKTAKDDRVRQDGAIAFHFARQSGADKDSYAHWILVRFDVQTIAK